MRLMPTYSRSKALSLRFIMVVIMDHTPRTAQKHRAAWTSYLWIPPELQISPDGEKFFDPPNLFIFFFLFSFLVHIVFLFLVFLFLSERKGTCQNLWVQNISRPQTVLQERQYVLFSECNVQISADFLAGSICVCLDIDLLWSLFLFTKVARLKC